MHGHGHFESRAKAAAVRLVLIPAVVVSLLAGVAGGLLRAGVTLPAVSGEWVDHAVLGHAFLMICTFMGTVIGVERAVAVKEPLAFAAPLASGLAGLLSCGFYQSANTATGEGYELTVIAAAVVGGASLQGGRGTALGALLGALVIKLIENGIDILKALPLGFATLPLGKEYGKIVIGVAILLAVAVDRLAERWSARRGG